MRTSLYFLCALILCLALGSCQNSKHFTKLALKQEEAGLTEEAAANYYTALLKNRSNVEAQIGMKKTGQLVLNQMLNDFAKQKNFGSNKEAVYAFHAARDYHGKIKNAGVNLLIADFYETDYRMSKDAYLTELYEEGTGLLEEQKFEDAEIKFKEIRKLEPNYKDSKDLADIAYLEPLYAKGVEALKIGNYRTAYDKFEAVIQRKATYKDAVNLQKQSLQKGQFTIAIHGFENASGTSGLDAKVGAYTLEALTGIKDPFLKVVDREHMEAILQEQKLQLSGVMDQNTAVTVGELVGASALLTGTVLSYSENKGTLRSKTRDGYQEYKEKVLNKEDGKYYYQSRYKAVKYTEYYNKNTCTVSFQYKLISLKTGEILRTEIIQKTIDDEVLYGKFDGEVSTLFPAHQNGPNLNANDKRALTSLMNGNQQMRNFSELSNDLFDQVTNKMSSEITQVVEEQVK
jgi:curli biogenesis system outer membrane secretion channel CsgG